MQLELWWVEHPYNILKTWTEERSAVQEKSNMVEKIVPMKVCVQVMAPMRTFRGLQSAFAGRMERASCCDSATLPGWS